MSARKRRLLVLSKYGTLAASTRQRFLQYKSDLEALDIEMLLSPLLDDSYVATIMKGTHRPVGTVATAYLKRLRNSKGVATYDGVIVHCEVFPYAPGFVETIGIRNAKTVIYDFDDAIFHQYDQHPNPWVRAALRHKLEPLLKRADIAICGNEYLRDYASRYCTRTEIVPTVVDTDMYTVANKNTESAAVIGWIGSPSTWNYVSPLAPLIAESARRLNLSVHIIGAGPQKSPLPEFEFFSWAEAEEVERIQSIDIGIMPLPDEPWARGKCGYKLIQYMACGLPVIASPVGVNKQIVEHGRNGFLASTDEEWKQAIGILSADVGLRRAMGAQGRIKVEKEFSLRSQGPRLAGFLHEALERRHLR